MNIPDILRDIFIAAAVFLSSSWILHWLTSGADHPTKAMAVLTGFVIGIVCVATIGIKQEKGHYE